MKGQENGSNISSNTVHSEMLDENMFRLRFQSNIPTFL